MNSVRQGLQNKEH